MSAYNLILKRRTIRRFQCKNKIRDTLNIPENYSIELVVALGYPAEESKIEEFRDSVRYWRDQKGVMHVPKRRLDSILHRNSYGGAL